MLLKKILAVALLLTTLIPVQVISAERGSINLANYLSYFYNKHSSFLDTTYQEIFHTWHFDIPYYETRRWQKTTTHPRWHISSAAFYSYRIGESPYARKLVGQAILDATINNNRAIFNQSFNDGIANFLVIRILQEAERATVDVLTPKEKQAVFAWIANRIPFGIAAPDTENRAALGAVYWFYTAQFLNEKKIISDSSFAEYKKKIDEKFEQSIKETIDEKTSQYKERGSFTLHYHIVEAYMVLIYGSFTNNEHYLNLARKMTDVVNELSKEDGFLDAQIGHRPSGIGAQGYLMAGALNLYFKNQEQAQKFFNYAYGDRFFKDAKYQNRLVWYNTSVQTPDEFNDDISFVNMAELTRVLFNEKEAQWEIN